MIDVAPVILCGVSGIRLGPLPRTGFTKRFVCLTDNKSFFHQGAHRLAALSDDSIQVAAPLIVNGEDHRFSASEQIAKILGLLM